MQQDMFNLRLSIRRLNIGRNTGRQLCSPSCFRAAWKGFFHDCSQYCPRPSVLFSSAVVLLGSLGLADAVLALPSSPPQQIAQRVVDSLPPPPSVDFDGAPLPVEQPALPPQPLEAPRSAPTPLSPTPQPQPAQPARPARPARPATPAPRPLPEDAAVLRYLVYVNGDSSLLLNQVRRIESEAFLREYEGRRIIQAGLFEQITSAEQQVEALGAQGIRAEVATVPIPLLSVAAPAPEPVSDVRQPVLAATTGDRQIEFGQQLGGDTPGLARTGTAVAATGNTYYVLVPGRPEHLADLQTQVTLLGEGLGTRSSLVSTQTDLAAHVLVGPFVNQAAAERWNRFLRDFGLDARVQVRR